MRRHGWAYSLVKRLEYDHELQINFHRWAIVFWLCNVPPIVYVLIVYPGEWIRIGVFYTAMLSLYANLDTDYDAMSAAEAALHAQRAEEQTKK